MKKKDFWDYQKKVMAPKPKGGSRFLRGILTFSILAASLTVTVSLFFYFFPTQASSAANFTKTFLSYSAQNIQKYLQNIFTQPAPEVKAETEAEPIPDLVPSTLQGNVSEIGDEGNTDTMDIDYLVMLDTSMGPMLYYSQRDSQWADYLYGGEDPIKQYGCGPTVVAMLVNSFTENPSTPREMADWCADHGYHAPQSGSYHSIIPDTLSAYGLQVESVSDRTYDNAAELLRSGHVLVALMGKGAFTSQGHFIIITKILDNGNVYIADCNSLDNTTKEWDLDQILEELKSGASDGGPLWAVGYKR